MLNIDHINEGDTHNYSFPTIDFKFQNTGAATAFLWQFAISVLQAEIDVTPVLAFKSNVELGALQIIATNNGWGVAHSCQVQVDDWLPYCPPIILNRLFADSARQYRGTIESGENQIILCLTKELAISDQLKAISKEFRPFQRDSLT